MKSTEKWRIKKNIRSCREDNPSLLVQLEAHHEIHYADIRIVQGENSWLVSRTQTGAFNNEVFIIGAISTPHRRRCELAGEARGRLMGRPSFSTLLATTGLLTLPSRFIF